MSEPLKEHSVIASYHHTTIRADIIVVIVSGNFGLTVNNMSIAAAITVSNNNSSESQGVSPGAAKMLA